MAVADKWLAFPFISQIRNFVRNEITNRENNRIAAKTPFIKVTPGYDVQGEATPIMKGIVTYGEGTKADPMPSLTFSGPHGVYNQNVAFRPRAGVTGLKVEYKNVVGAVRQATLEWTCFSLDDLQFLAKYYMHPGMTLFMEWGWSNIPTDIIRTSDNYDAIDFTLDNHYVKVQKNVKKSNGNYDAMIGFITNYSIDLKPDGSYVCSTKIASMADIMDGLIFTQQKDKKLEEMQGSELSKYAPDSLKSIILSYLDMIIDQYYKDEKKFGYLDGSIKSDVFVLDATQIWKFGGTNKTTRDPKDKDSSTQNKKSPRYYSWGFLEDHIINKYMAMYANPEGIHASLGTTKKNKPVFCVDSTESKIGLHYNLRTTDLGTFIFPNMNRSQTNFDKYYSNLTDVKGFYGKLKNQGIRSSTSKTAEDRKTAALAEAFVKNKPASPPKSTLEYYLGFPEVVPDNVKWIMPLVAKDGNVGIDESTQKRYINPRCLLISEDLLKSAVDRTVDPLGFISVMLAQINNSCGNYWDLRLQATDTTGDPDNEEDRPMSKYTIVDLKFTGGADNDPKFKDKIYTFRMKPIKPATASSPASDPKTSIIRDVKFTSNLGNAAALNVFYNSHLKATDPNQKYYVNGTDALYTGLYFTDVNKFVRDRFFKKQVNYIQPDLEKKSFEESLPTAENYEGDQVGFDQNLKLFLPLWQYGYRPIFNGLSVSAGARPEDNELKIEYMEDAKNILRALTLQIINKNEIPSSRDILTPLTLELELEGISGIRPGDMFNLDYIPEQYRINGAFQVKALSHTVDRGFWTTKVVGGYRMWNVDPNKNTGAANPVQPGTNSNVKPIPANASANQPMNVSKGIKSLAGGRLQQR